MDRAEQTTRQIRTWLGTGIIMLLAQILLGGITRLTGSGLSITEWKPLMGVLPPLSATEWRHSFEKYQQIAQFKKLNNHFMLADYQSLYFWEWLHREWARLMTFVFIVPFVIFLGQRKFNRRQGWQLAGLFFLGTVQGLAGWLMVQSGLNDTDLNVSHIRLAVHFFLALLLLIYIFWMYLKLWVPRYAPVKYRRLTLLIIMVLGFQLIYGAFMAGTHAALYAPTWPDINGTFFATSPAITGSCLYRVTCDPLMIQFIHRLLAYLLSGLLLTWFLCTPKLSGHLLSRSGTYPLVLLMSQVALGISCLLNSGTPLFIWLAVLHQLNAILLLLSMVRVLYQGSGGSI